MRVLKVLLLVLATHDAYAFAQQPGQSARGVVRDTAGTPLGSVDIFFGERRAMTNAQGVFRVDSLRPGQYVVLIRLVGYTPIRSRVTLKGEVTELEYVLVPAPVLLPTLVVDGRRTGIYGTIADPAFHAAVGARVQVLGFKGGEATTDTTGRFAFPEADRGTYMVRVTFPGYREHRMSLTLARGEGRDLAIRLSPGAETVSGAEEGAFQDLRQRLAIAFQRENLSSADLARYGSADLCNVPMPIEGARGTPTIIVNGVVVYHDMPRHFLCFWRANEVELVEFGPDVCRESSQSIAYLLNAWCSASRNVRRSILGSGKRVTTQQYGGSYVIIWEKK